MHYLYRLTNQVNGKIYIGQSSDISKRWSDHKAAVKHNRPTQIIHHALLKYGIDKFDWDVIATCQTWDDANELETILVSQYESHISTGKGYNSTRGGYNAPKTEEWKQKISNVLMGHEVSKETRDKISKVQIGKVLSNETKNKISAFNKGKKVSEETREKLSKINLGNKNCLGKKNGLGHFHTEEAKKKIGDASRGKTTKYKGKTWKVIDGKRVWIDVIRKIDA